MCAKITGGILWEMEITSKDNFHIEEKKDDRKVLEEIFANNACRMKTRLDGFWRALIKILLFGPLCSPWKKMKNGLLGDSNRRQLQTTSLVGRVISKYYGDFLLFNTNYAFDG